MLNNDISRIHKHNFQFIICDVFSFFFTETVNFQIIIIIIIIIVCLIILRYTNINKNII